MRIAGKQGAGVHDGLYGLVLNAVATKAVHQLSWGRAALPSIILAGLSAVLFVGLVIIQVALALQQAGP